MVSLPFARNKADSYIANAKATQDQINTLITFVFLIGAFVFNLSAVLQMLRVFICPGELTPGIKGCT